MKRISRRGGLAIEIDSLRSSWGMPAPDPTPIVEKPDDAPVLKGARALEVEVASDRTLDQVQQTITQGRLTRPQGAFLAKLRACENPPLLIPVKEFTPSTVWPLHKRGLILVDIGADDDAPIAVSLTAKGSRA